MSPAARAYASVRGNAKLRVPLDLVRIEPYVVPKRNLTGETMEVLGGNGYVEEDGHGVQARIYREMPVNSIWEGAGNIMAIDLLRALRKGDVAGALQAELAPARGAHAALDRMIELLPTRIEALANETEARRLAQDVALALQGALLAQTAPAAVTNAFCASRLGGDWGQAFGTLSARADMDAIVARAMP